jgi:hypothetical protein
VSRGPTIVLTLVGLLLLAAGCAVTFAMGSGSRSTTRGEEFQDLVGGLGGGPATDLSVCEFRFDPRLDFDCSLDVGVAPAAKSFCACHGCTIETGPVSD